jgi:hypothetical protein
MNLTDIHTNNIFSCIRCDDPITLDNYTGWEDFLPDGRTTQPICKFCYMAEDLEIYEKENGNEK